MSLMTMKFNNVMSPLEINNVEMISLMRIILDFDVKFSSKLQIMERSPAAREKRFIKDLWHLLSTSLSFSYLELEN